MNGPHIRYYVVKVEPKTLEQIERELREYHEKHGKHGFLSERTRAEDLPARAKKLYEVQKDVAQSIASIGFLDKPEKDAETIKKVEAREDFVRWMPNEAPEGK